MNRKHDLQWPERRPTYDSVGRLVEEEHILHGVIIARITFNPQTGHKTSYSSGKVILYFGENEALIKKVIHNDNNQVLSVECYSTTTRELHSEDGRPSKVKYSEDGNVVYLAWHREGKKDRPSKLDKKKERLIPQPAVVRYLRDDIVENAFYRNDMLTDPNDQTAAIQYMKNDELVLKCHFKENRIHKTDDPVLIAKHDAMNLIAFAKNGNFLSARFEEPGHISSHLFNDEGEMIETQEEFDLENESQPACGIQPLLQGLGQQIASEQLSEFSKYVAQNNDLTDPSNRRKLERAALQNGDTQ